MEKLNLIKILKNVPEGTKLWSNSYGTTEFQKIELGYRYTPIITSRIDVTLEGKISVSITDAECILWPSKEIRDWSRWEEELKWREIEQWIADGVCEACVFTYDCVDSEFIHNWVDYDPSFSESLRKNPNALLDFRIKPKVDPYKELKEAYERGEVIQLNQPRMFGVGGWSDFTKKTHCILSWERPLIEYRIKPKEQYIPFTFEDRDIFRGKWVRCKEEDGFVEAIIHVIIISDFIGHVVEFSDYSCTLKEAFERITFLDGTPFGKLAE